MFGTTHVHNESLGLQMSGQNFDDRGSLQTSVDLDTVLDDLGLKLKRQSTGRLQGIQNADIALKDGGSGTSQV